MTAKGSLVVLVFLDALRFDGRWIKRHSVLGHSERGDRSEDGFETAQIVVTMGEKISIPSRAMRLLGREFKEQRALEDEDLLTVLR